MNEAIQPFMARASQNYFIINKDGHRFECFMQEGFEQESINNLGEEERKYKTTISVKVLGYLIGEGDNQEKPQVIKEENAVEIKIPRENLSLIQEEPRKQKEAPSLLRNAGTQLAAGIPVKKVFSIGNNIDSVYLITHNLNSRDLFIKIREDFGDFSVVEASVTFIDSNTISIDMGDIVDINSYIITILG